MENPQSGLGVTGPVAKFNWLYWSVTGFSLLGIGAVLVALMLPPVTRGREAPRRTQCKNNLKQIAVALWQYQEEWHALPPAITIDSYGRPLHSWRTLILPYLDQRPLYEKIDLSKPWDDPVNAELLSKAPWVYRCPSGSGPPNHTTYLACVVPNGSFRPIDPRVVSEIKDRFAETLLVIEVPPDRAVP